MHTNYKISFILGVTLVCLLGWLQPFGITSLLTKTPDIDRAVAAAQELAYDWQVRSAWTCQNEQQTRQVACRDQGTGEFVDDQFCDVATKPIESYSGACFGKRTAVTAGDATTVTWEGEGYQTNDERQWLKLPYDAVVTRVEMKTEWKRGAVGDYGLFVYREDEPAYPQYSGGYTGLFTININQLGSDDPWTQVFDFSDTPLFIPAGTNFRCSGSGGNAPANTGHRSCAVTYRAYDVGEPRFRANRIPYLDAAYENNSFVSSRYVSNVASPLRVHGFVLYDAVFNGSYTACLERRDGSGSVEDDSCLSRTKNTHNDFHPFDVQPLSWNLLPGESLTARCDAANPSNKFDCAFYIVTELPDTISASPENIFRDYGNIQADDLANWCSSYVDGVVVDSQALQLCQYDFACSKDDTSLEQACVAAFPAASCMGTDSCFETAEGIDLTVDPSSLTEQQRQALIVKLIELVRSLLIKILMSSSIAPETITVPEESIEDVGVAIEGEVADEGPAGEPLVEDISFNFRGGEAELVETEAGNEQAKLTLAFEITASGDHALYIPASAEYHFTIHDKGVNYILRDGDAVVTNDQIKSFSSDLSSTAAEDGGYFVVSKGDTERFTLTVFLDPIVNGTYKMDLRSINYNTRPAKPAFNKTFARKTYSSGEVLVYGDAADRPVDPEEAIQFDLHDVTTQLQSGTEREDRRDAAEFTFAFDVSARGADLYIPASAEYHFTIHDKGVNYILRDGDAAVTNDQIKSFSSDLSSTAAEDGGYFVVSKGDTERFTLTVELVPDSLGVYSVDLRSINYNLEPELPAYNLTFKRYSLRTDSVQIEL